MKTLNFVWLTRKVCLTDSWASLKNQEMPEAAIFCGKMRGKILGYNTDKAGFSPFRSEIESRPRACRNATKLLGHSQCVIWEVHAKIHRRFKKQRIKAQIFICTHPLFVMFFNPKLSWSCIRPCLSLCSDIPVMVRILTIYFEQTVISFLSRVCRTSFFLILLSLFFLPELFLFVITASGMPQFRKSIFIGFDFLGFSFIFW